jgi:hypothetical protein
VALRDRRAGSASAVLAILVDDSVVDEFSVAAAITVVLTVAIVARQLSLKSSEIGGGGAVLEFPGHLRLLGLRTAAPHGSTPSHAGTKPSGGSAASLSRLHPLGTTVQGCPGPVRRGRATTGKCRVFHCRSPHCGVPHTARPLPSFGEAALLGEQLVDRGGPAGIPGADLSVAGVHDLLHLAAPLRYR